MFTLKLLECEVFLAYEEPEILSFVLRLSDDSLPLKLDCIGIFLSLDQLEMQVVVLLDETLVFLLQWKQSLRV
jgi:hypothetical protein